MGLMMNTSAFVEIIKDAATSALGIVALCCLLFAYLTVRLSGPVSTRIRFTVFVTLFAGFVGLLLASTYRVTPAVANPALVSIDDVPAKQASGSPSAVAEAAVVEETPESRILSTDEYEASFEPRIRVLEQRVDCGQLWAGWGETGVDVGDPCPEGCYRGQEFGQRYRVVGFPPVPEVKHKFQCWRDEQVTTVDY